MATQEAGKEGRSGHVRPILFGFSPGNATQVDYTFLLLPNPAHGAPGHSEVSAKKSMDLKCNQLTLGSTGSLRG